MTRHLALDTTLECPICTVEETDLHVCMKKEHVTYIQYPLFYNGLLFKANIFLLLKEPN